MNPKFCTIVLASTLLSASTALASHSWGNYHWARSSNPLKLEIDSAITSQWTIAVGGSISDWDSSAVLQLSRPSIEPSVSRKRCSAILGKVLVCNDSYGQRGWLGIATIWANGNHITQATTKLNDSYFSLSTYNTAAWRAFVACQEVGHDFGLAHQDDSFGAPNIGSCMDYTNDPDGGGAYGPSNEHPDAHDYNQLEAMYGHTDTSSTSATQSTDFGVRIPGRGSVAGLAVGVASDPGDSPAEWGRAIGTDGLGRPNLFVADLGGGRRKLTHVFWAIGEGPRGK